MRFLANENVPRASVRRLRAAGHDVRAVIEEAPGLPDHGVLSLAAADHRILVTLDRDYGYLVYRRIAPLLAGVVYFRFDPVPPEEPADRLLQLLASGSPTLEGRFTVVERGHVRQRPLPRSKPHP